MMRCFLKVLLILFMFSCWFFSCHSMSYKLSEDEKIVRQITKKTAKNIEEKKDLILVGTGARMMYEIEMLAMSFHYYQEVNLDQARELLTYAVNEYLDAINSSEAIRPYLHEYPFTPKNVSIRIFIYGPDRRELPPEKIGYASSRDGILRYYNRADTMHPIYEETYDEALGKITSYQEVADIECRATNF